MEYPRSVPFIINIVIEVYSQAGLAASKAFSEQKAKSPSFSGKEFGIHVSTLNECVTAMLYEY